MRCIIYKKIDYDFCVKFLLSYCDSLCITLKELSYRVDVDYSTLRKFLFERMVNGRDTFKIINFIIESKGGVLFYEDLENN